jgi:hypothetical protein
MSVENRGEIAELRNMAEKKRKRKENKTCHNELDGTNEEHQKLENHVLTLFFHGVQAPLLSTGDNLSLSQTDTRVSLELVLGDDTTTTGGSLLFVVDLMAVLGLEVLDQGVHVLIGLFIVGDGSLGVVGSGRSLSSLLIEAASLDVGVQRRSADRLLFGHCG